MDTIIIRDFAVSCRVGVTEVERSAPQRLLVTLELSHDCSTAAARDDITHAIDYSAVCQRLLNFGERNTWKLIETLAADIIKMIRAEFRPASIVVEVQKFVIPEARYVAVRMRRP